ncbi:MAG: hypothetical protein AAF191_11975 [Verrucomicrobiota bacterium]
MSLTIARLPGRPASAKERMKAIGKSYGLHMAVIYEDSKSLFVHLTFHLIGPRAKVDALRSVLRERGITSITQRIL